MIRVLSKINQIKAMIEYQIYFHVLKSWRHFFASLSPDCSLLTSAKPVRAISHRRRHRRRARLRPLIRRRGRRVWAPVAHHARAAAGTRRTRRRSHCVRDFADRLRRAVAAARADQRQGAPVRVIMRCLASGWVLPVWMGLACGYGVCQSVSECVKIGVWLLCLAWIWCLSGV
jgi:hypothetical protein